MTLTGWLRSNILVKVIFWFPPFHLKNCPKQKEHTDIGINYRFPGWFAVLNCSQENTFQSWKQRKLVNMTGTIILCFPCKGRHTFHSCMLLQDSVESEKCLAEAECEADLPTGELPLPSSLTEAPLMSERKTNAPALMGVVREQLTGGKTISSRCSNGRKGKSHVNLTRVVCTVWIQLFRAF